MNEYLTAVANLWAAQYAPSNVRGLPMSEAQFLAPHFANTGGVTAGLEAIPTGGTSLALGTFGANYAGTPNAAFAQIVTALVSRNIVENVRKDAILLQNGGFIKASHVPGTSVFRYVAFPDLGVAENLLEGVPPQPEGLAWDVMEFSGGQKGKLVGITDLAELFSPFDMYRIAAEKIAWNALDTAENDLAVLLAATGAGVPYTPVGATLAIRLVNWVVAMKMANVPTFADGSYHMFVSPAAAAAVMTETGELGWTDTVKYANGTALLNGELGKFRGIRFIESTRIDTVKQVLHGPDFAVWGDYQTIQAYRVAPGGDHADPLAQRGLVGWKGMWGLALVQFDGTPAIGGAVNPRNFKYSMANVIPVPV